MGRNAMSNGQTEAILDSQPGDFFIYKPGWPSKNPRKTGFPSYRRRSYGVTKVTNSYGSNMGIMVKFPLMSAAAKKKWQDPEYRRKQSQDRATRDYSHLHTPEVVLKVVKKNLGRKSSIEARQKISKSREGWEYTDAEIIRQMESHGREIWYGGVRYYLREPRTSAPENPAHLLSYIFAWDFTLLNKHALRERMRETRGPMNPRWKGGITKLNHAIRDCQKGLEWRQRVFERDNFTCQQTGQRGGKLHAHHIMQIKDLIEKYGIRTLEDAYACEAFWDVSNGVTMTEQAHKDWHKENGK